MRQGRNKHQSPDLDTMLLAAEMSQTGISNTARKVLNVATGCSLPLTKTGGVNTCNSRSPHKIHDGMKTGLVAIIPNWYSVGGVETAPGAPTTCTATVEYPLGGTRYPVTFNGQMSGVAPDGGQIATDPFIIPGLQEGDTVHLRVFRSCASGIPYTAYSQLTPQVSADMQFEAGASVTDKTVSGTIPAATVNIFAPAAIVAATTKKSVAVMGDSTPYGAADTIDNTGLLGWACRALAPVAPVMNLAYPSNQAVTMATTAGNDRALALANAYSSEVILQIGTNDLAGASTAATILGRLTTIAGKLTSKQRVYGVTAFPRTTSTDSWTTTANQTVLSTEAERVKLNTGVRAIPAGFTDAIDVASVIETSFNSGIFKVESNSASPAITEGVHLLGNGYRMVARSGIVPLERFRGHW